MIFVPYRLLDSETKRHLKLVLFVTISNSLAMTWDILGLKVDVTREYLLLKLFFLIFPPFFLFLNLNLKVTTKLLIICMIFYFYCFYNTLLVDFSYYTSFIQFLFGSVFFLNLPVKKFIISHGTGIGLYFTSVILLKDILPTTEYESKVTLMNGAVIPIIGISILIYFYIRRREELDLAKSVFFQQIGTNVGFILHEIKQPLKKIQSEYGGKNIDELSELLETANLMWPTQKNQTLPQATEFKFSDLTKEVLSQYEGYIDHIDVKIIKTNLEQIVTVNKVFMRIILKNLLKNALEESLSNGYRNFIKIELSDNRHLVVSNSFSGKINHSKIFNAGFSSKKNVSNRGLGLFICKQLCSKMGASINITAEDQTFIAKVSY